MSRISWAVGRSALALFLLIAISCTCTLFSQTESLGDVAREQKEIRKQREKDDKTTKALTNGDLTPGPAVLASETADPPAASNGQTQSGQGQSREGTCPSPKAHAPDAENAVEGNEDSTPDVIIVPAGTELKVDMSEHKTVVPVRVGFATPIPALSHVTVEVTRTYEPIPYYAGLPYSGLPYADYVDYATITAVTVAGETYSLQTDPVQLLNGGPNSEITFTLSGPVQILR